MNKSARPLRSRLVRLNRQLSKVVEFRNPQDEESTGSKFAKGAAAVGGVAAAYGGAAYLRGRLSQKPGDWNFRQNQPGLKGVLANIGAGHRANVADMRTAIGGGRRSGRFRCEDRSFRCGLECRPADPRQDPASPRPDAPAAVRQVNDFSRREGPVTG